MTVKLALRVYTTTILPYFDYADILFMNANVNLLQKLQYAQNRCLNICLILPHLTHTNVVHHQANIPLLHHRRYSHMFKLYVQKVLTSLLC